MHHNERNLPNVPPKVYPALSTQVQHGVTERSTTQNGAGNSSAKAVLTPDIIGKYGAVSITEINNPPVSGQEWLRRGVY